MAATDISRKHIAELRERLADIEHERWTHWQKYMHGKGTRSENGSLVIPGDLADRWERQCDMSYADLSEEEKQSDREQVDKYLPLLLDALGVRIKD